MKLLIKVIPCEYDGHFMTVKLPSKPIHTIETEVNNGLILEAKLLNLKDVIFEDAVIWLYPQSRKFRGFDKWEKEHKQLLEHKGPVYEPDGPAY